MATKKISELPLVNRVSGSQVNGGSVLPIVIGGGLQGTTNQISVEDFSIFVNAYNAHTGSAGNVFTGPQTINNNVTINGRLTVTEVVAQYETASILFSTGSTKLGDQLTDKHEITGSTNLTGSLIYNGVLTTNIDINTVNRLQQTTSSLQFHSASVDAQLARVYQTTQSLHVATSSLQFHSASVDAQLLRLQQTTQSLQVATASLQAFSSSVNDQLQRVYQTTQSLHVATASLQFHSASVDAQLLAIQQTTQSLQVATASLNAFTASQDSRNFVISQFTSSTNAHILGISDFTSSQLNVNLGNAIYTASVDSHIVGISTYTSSVRDTFARVHQATQSLQVATASLQAFTASQDGRNFVISQFTASTNNHIVGISTFTSSQYDTMARVYQTTSSLQSTTASLNQFTASQDSRNLTLSTVTGSLIGITNGLMAFTAALDNTYATDAQLYQLYQATRSLELNSGSMIGVTNGLMAYTSSNETWKTGIRGEISGIEAWTASLDSLYATDAQLTQLYQATRSIELTTGSLIGITNGLMAYTSSNETWKTGVRGEISAIEAWTASLDSTYATDAQLYQLYAETASIKAEIAGIEALTASFKAAAIVSSSTQIQNYFTFAQTSSANTFYGNQSITGSLNVNNGITGSFKGNLAGVADYASTIVVVNTGTTTDTTLYPTFTLSPILAQYTSLYSHASSSFFFNGVTRRLHMEGFVVSGSNNIAEISGSLNVSGSVNTTGSLTIDSVLAIVPRNTTPAIGTVPTGSIIVSASVGRPKPWMWDGWDWNPFY